MGQIRLLGGTEPVRARLGDWLLGLLEPKGWHVEVLADVGQRTGQEPVLVLWLAGLACDKGGQETAGQPSHRPEPGLFNPKERALWHRAHVRLQWGEATAGEISTMADLHAPVDAIWAHAVPDGVTSGEPVDSAGLPGFGAWLQLGASLARSRFETQTGRVALIESLLNTRTNIATALHNGPVQELVASTFLLGMVPDGLGQPVQQQIDAALVQLRQMCQGLKPPALHDFGLAPALRAACKSLGQQDATFDPVLDFDPDLPDLSAFCRDIYYLYAHLALNQLVALPGLRIERLSLLGDTPTPGDVSLTVYWQVENDEDGSRPLEGGNHARTFENAMSDILPLLCQLAYAVHGKIFLASRIASRQAARETGPVDSNGEGEPEDGWAFDTGGLISAGLFSAQELSGAIDSVGRQASIAPDGFQGALSLCARQIPP